MDGDWVLPLIVLGCVAGALWIILMIRILR